MQRFLPLLLSGCLSIRLAHAQTTISFGPRLGGNLAMGTFSILDQAAGASGSYAYTRSALVGYQVGLAASVGRGHWALQPALVFTEKGLKQRVMATDDFAGIAYTEDYRVSCRVHYLELPINVVYSFGANGEGVQLFAGPYVAIGVGGQAQYTLDVSSPNPAAPFAYSESGSQAFAFGSTFAEPDPNTSSGADARARRFDAGLNAGVGYRRGPVQVQLGYGMGLLNAQPNYPASYQLRNDTGYHRTGQLTATYYFSGPPK